MTAAPPTLPVSRWRRATASIGGAVVARIVGVICALVQVPLALHLLGIEGFGAWAILGTTAGLVVLLDGGTGFALQNAVSEAAARHDSAKIAALVGSVLRLQCVAGLAFAAVGALAWTFAAPRLAPWFASVGGNAAGGWLEFVALMALVQVAALPCFLAGRLAFALQSGWLVAVHTATTNLLTLLLTLAATAGHWSPHRFVALACLIPLALHVALFAWLRRRWTSPAAPAAPPGNRWRESWAWSRRGLVFWVPQAASTLHQQLPQAVVAAIAGPAAVAPFALLARLFNFTTMPQQSWLESIWPALTDAYARGDTAWARVAVRRTLLVVAGGAVLPLVLSPWWAPPLLSWWTQLPGTAFPPELLRAMSLSLAASLMLAPVSVWLNARGRPHGQSIYGTIAIVILLITLPRAVALGGAAAAPLVTLAVTACLLVPAMVIDLAITQRIVLKSR